MSYFSLNKIGFSYEGKVVLEDIHFSVEKGDYLCIVGENGAGKSTLLKGILGLKKPGEGEIILGDGLKKAGYRISSPTDGGAEGFPCQCLRGGGVRMPKQAFLISLLS